MGSLSPGFSGGSGLRVQEFRSSGTWINPGVKTVSLFMVGGGGGSSGPFVGAEGGNVVELNYDVNGKASCAVVIGAGGTQGGNGGNTTFDGTAVAGGGSPDAYGSTSSGPTGYFGFHMNAGKNGFGGHGISNGTSNHWTSSSNGSRRAGSLANTGAGGGAGLAGGSGYLRVEWYE